ncbi:DUF4184 family protein [Streptomyces sp. SID4919]|uniref:DUF4184 family protein n=1 Tax=unclassified Streptomyces TaxID=2593676 RepID=UPI000823E8E9|nr:DUF4184 family protein [Streptomyces sp. AmelKG-E11A]MYY11935.1 DUF4184 family protein [Streptomyces sp. SID4919]SCK13263.1 protein of unknown function [Streptomyces sp. AmelKG-E11A]
MPFTLSHPAAVLPLLRPPFVPVALVAGAMAPDTPYFLGTLGIPLSAGDWYEPFLNATTSHSPLGALTVSLPVALALAAGWLLLRGPVTELLPRPAPRPAPAPTAPAPALTPAPTASATESAAAVSVAVSASDPWVRRVADVVRRGGWLLLSALIGVATHLLWDSFTHLDGYVVTRVAFLRESGPGGTTVARLLQHLSTVVGLALLAVHLWRRRGRKAGRRGREDDRFGDAGAGTRMRTRTGPLTRTGTGLLTRTRMGTRTGTGMAPGVRWAVIGGLVLAALLGGAARTQGIDAYRHVTVYDTDRPITRVDADGGTWTTYPARGEHAPWTQVAEGLLSDGAKGAGVSLAAALLVYSAGRHLSRVPRGSRKVAGGR